jgi:AcrR family transcriptional regulator
VNGFERRKQRKKESIRRAALELFKAHGFKRVSIGEIAHRADVSPVTIYNYFGSRDALIQDVVKGQFLDLLERLRAIIRGEGTFPEKIEALVLDKTEVAGAFQGELTQTLLSGNPEMQRFVETVWRRDVDEMTAELFEQGKRQGYVSEEISQEALVLYLDMLRRGASASSEELAAFGGNVRFLRELNHLFLYGMMGRKDGKR